MRSQLLLLSVLHGPNGESFNAILCVIELVTTTVLIIIKIEYSAPIIVRILYFENKFKQTDCVEFVDLTFKSY